MIRSDDSFTKEQVAKTTKVINKLIEKTEQGKVDWVANNKERCNFKIGNGEFSLLAADMEDRRIVALTIFVNNGMIAGTFTGEEVERLADLVHGKYLSSFEIDRNRMLDEVIAALDKLI